MTDPRSWAAARADMYKFTSAAFLEPPSERLLAPLLKGGFVDGLSEIFGTEAVRDLRHFIEAFQGDYETLDQEFQSLFMVPLGRYVTPYEAVYRDAREIGDARVHGLLMGPSALAVKQLYREAGVAISDDFMDLPDHVGLELACMEFLCRAEAQAWNQENLAGVQRARVFQKKLLDEHMLRWIPALCERIRERAAGPFYRGIATLTEAYLAQEAELLTLPILTH